jgi:hypothetical protein
MPPGSVLMAHELIHMITNINDESGGRQAIDAVVNMIAKDEMHRTQRRSEGSGQDIAIRKANILSTLGEGGRPIHNACCDVEKVGKPAGGK